MQRAVYLVHWLGFGWLRRGEYNVFRLTIVIEWMDGNHWSDDGMVTIHRSGLMYCLSSTQSISASNCRHMCNVSLQAKKEYDSDDEEDAKKTEVVEDPGTLNDEYRWCLSLDSCGSKIVRYCQYSSARLFKWRQPLISKTSPTSLESPSRSIALLHPLRYFV